MTGRVTTDGANLAGAARSGIVSLAGSGVAAVAGLGLNVVIGRGLGPAASGVFFVAVAVLTVAATVGKLGADTGLVRELARLRGLGRPGDVRRVLLVALVPAALAGLLLAVAVHLAAGPIGALIAPGPGAGAGTGTGAGADVGTDVARLLDGGAPYLLLGGPFLVLTAGLRGLGDVVGFAGVQNVVVPVLRTLLTGLAVATGLGVSGALLGWNAPLVVGTAVAAWLVVRRSRSASSVQAAPVQATSPPPARPYPVLAREFWSFSAPRSVAAVLEVAIVWADVIIVASLTSPREAGIYAAASRFITTGSLAEAAMRVAMAPQISKLLALGDLAGAARLCAVATQWIVLLAWPLYLVLALYAPYVLALFGPGFVEGSTALTVLAVAMIVVMSAGNNQTVLLMSGRSGAQLRNKALALAVDLGLNLLLVPAWGLGWGMTGAALAWAVTVLLDATLVLAQVRWSIGVRIPMGRVWPAMALAATGFVPTGLLARFVLGPDGSPLWLVPLVAGVGGYGVLLHRFRHRLDVEPLRQALGRSAGGNPAGGSADGSAGESAGGGGPQPGRTPGALRRAPQDDVQGRLDRPRGRGGR